MTCSDMNAFLSGWLDGELNPARARAVSAHRETCERCRETSDAWAAQAQHLRAAGRRVPAPPSWEALVERLVGAPAAQPLDPVTFTPARQAPARRRPVAWLAAGAAAALVLLGIAGIFALRPVHTIASREAAEHLPADLVRQLVDAARPPDLSPLGAVTPVSWDRFSRLPRDARFAPMAPPSLPGGYLFDEGWVIESKICRMVCARYRKGGRVVALLQAESNGAPVCTLANPQCCRIAGMMCRRSRIERVDVLQATRGRLALTIAAKAGETDMEAVMASLDTAAGIRKD